MGSFKKSDLPDPKISKKITTRGSARAVIPDNPYKSVKT